MFIMFMLIEWVVCGKIPYGRIARVVFAPFGGMVMAGWWPFVALGAKLRGLPGVRGGFRALG
jgi:hypothetical protein